MNCKPTLRRKFGMDGKLVALDAAEFRDGSGSISYSDIFEQSPALQKEVADAAAERRRVQDCRFSNKDAADAGATIQTSCRKATLTGYR